MTRQILLHLLKVSSLERPSRVCLCTYRYMEGIHDAGAAKVMRWIFQSLGERHANFCYDGDIGAPYRPTLQSENWWILPLVSAVVALPSRRPTCFPAELRQSLRLISLHSEISALEDAIVSLIQHGDSTAISFMHYVRSRQCVVSWSCDQFRSRATRSGACASWDWRVSRMSALTSSCLLYPARAFMPCNWSSSVKPGTRPEHLTILSHYNCVYLSCWKFAGFSTRLCTINWAPSARQFTCKGIPESSRASYMQIAIFCKYNLFNCKHDKAEALFSVQQPYRAFTWLLCNLMTALKSNGSTCFSKTCCDCVCDSSSLLIALPSCKVIACFNQAHRNWFWQFVSSEHRPFLTPATAFASSESATVDPRIPSEASGPLFLKEIKSSYLRLLNKAGCLKCHELGRETIMRM